MLTYIGILIALIGAITIILKPIFKTNTILAKFSLRRSLQLISAGIVLGVISGAFFYAEPGTAYAVQYPWGGQKAVFRQGINTKMWGRLIPLQFELPIKYVIPNSEGQLGEQSEYANVDLSLIHI